MSEYKKLKEKFDQDIKELQENCPHEKLSEPVEVYWAPGHSSGYSSRYCERCGKQMYRPPPPKLEGLNEKTKRKIKLVMNDEDSERV